MKKTVGGFVVEVLTSSGSPSTYLSFRGAQLEMIRPEDLRDLEYAVQAAIKAVNDRRDPSQPPV